MVPSASDAEAHANLTAGATGPAPSLMPPALASLPIATTLAAESARPIAGPAAAPLGSCLEAETPACADNATQLPPGPALVSATGADASVPPAPASAPAPAAALAAVPVLVAPGDAALPPPAGRTLLSTNTAFKFGAQRLPQPEKFSGSHTSRRVEDFLRSCRLYMDTTGIPAAQQSVFGSFMLTVDAEILLASKLNDLKVRTGATLPSMTWDEFQIMVKLGLLQTRNQHFCAHGFEFPAPESLDCA